MRIVVLDGYTLNPGDLDWSSLRALGPCEVFDRTRREELPARAHAAEIILTNKTILSANSIIALPHLKYIGVLATGTNVVDLAAARARKIPVTNVPAYGTRSVAQATFALLLELTNQAGHHAQTVRAGRWAKNPDWCYWDSPLLELDGLTLGIVGYGRIGRAVADIARAFGMKTLVHSRTPVADAGNVSLNELLANSDIVSLHCPLTP
ncbi:MAG: D-2-hydroxyacid dehydrogenase, partial [Verrucomicrobia bacterium]|nr:D-2-hydroxyacid dehydrogenase [Verrucomicrobiota bacterium]